MQPIRRFKRNSLLFLIVFGVVTVGVFSYKLIRHTDRVLSGKEVSNKVANLQIKTPKDAKTAADLIQNRAAQNDVDISISNLENLVQQ